MIGCEYVGWGRFYDRRYLVRLGCRCYVGRFSMVFLVFW